MIHYTEPDWMGVRPVSVDGTLVPLFSLWNTHQTANGDTWEFRDEEEGGLIVQYLTLPYLTLHYATQRYVTKIISHYITLNRTTVHLIALR